jgi:hypothetical protein
VDEGNLADGEKRIRRGIDLNPSFWMGYYQFARLELLRDRLPQAEADAEQHGKFVLTDRWRNL